MAGPLRKKNKTKNKFRWPLSSSGANSGGTFFAASLRKLSRQI